MMMPDILSLSTAESSLLCSTLMVTRTLTRSPLSGRPYSLTCLTRRVLSAMTRLPFSMRRRNVKRSSESSGIIKKAVFDVPLGFTIILSFRLQLQQMMMDLDPVLVVVVDFGLTSNSCQPIPASRHLTQLGWVEHLVMHSLVTS